MKNNVTLFTHQVNHDIKSQELHLMTNFKKKEKQQKGLTVTVRLDRKQSTPITDLFAFQIEFAFYFFSFFFYIF